MNSLLSYLEQFPERLEGTAASRSLVDRLEILKKRAGFKASGDT